MNREFLKGLEGLTDETIDKIMAENGKDIQKAQGQLDAVKAELKSAKETVTSITGELQALKDSNADAEDWKGKFEELQRDVAAKEQAEKEEKARLVREEHIKARYDAACTDSAGNPLEWSHEAVKADYLKKFTEALEDEAYAGKSDKDIFHALTKDDGAAFKHAQPEVRLKGAEPIGGAADELAAAKAVMGIK